jgi:hypothetical protein
MIGWLALAEDAALLRCSSKAEARAEAIVAHAETIDGCQEKCLWIHVHAHVQCMSWVELIVGGLRTERRGFGHFDDL